MCASRFTGFTDQTQAMNAVLLECSDERHNLRPAFRGRRGSQVKCNVDPRTLIVVVEV